ncbi:MAG: Multi-sensor signal transduction histidine kinase [uncultured bacterium]|nr:MAG: Multi-sensor signal transduction histidine kinase [uncultured bacterium]
MEHIAEYFSDRKKLIYWTFIISMTIGLYLTTLVNYLLFHSIVELFSIVIASTVFIITWNSVQYIKNPYLMMVGISYFFIGILDLLHMLAYKGMPIFTDYDYYANQLWIAARYLESITLIAAFALLYRDKKVKPGLILVSYTLITGLLIASIFYWKIFPICFIAGKGLTDFKVYSEYIICAILIGSIILLYKNRVHFTGTVYRLIFISIIYTIISELAFTFYINNYGISNLVGHYFKLFSFMMIYHAIVTTGIEDPYHLIFNELNLTNKSLHKEAALRKKTELEREAVIQSLKNALDEIKTLKGIIPICSYCKKIRDDKKSWHQLETYISNHSEALFSHGICPACMDEQMKVINAQIDNK